jgi:hypothetical protein
MPKKERKRKERKGPPSLDAWQIRYLCTGKTPDKKTIAKEKIDPFDIWNFKHEKDDRVAWKKHGKSILAAYIKKHPGKRPWMWWRFEAPRWDRKFGAWFDGKLPEPRQRIGGTGTPCYEVLAYAPFFNFGIPVSFVDQFQAEYYNGKAKDKHGNLIEYQRKGGDFKGIAIDFDDLPTFEAEASYLKRHNLLPKNEQKQLKSGDLEPESCEKYIK